MMYRPAAVLACGLVLVGCSSREQLVVHREGEPDVHLVAPEDTAVLAARRRAKDQLPTFILALSDSTRGLRELALKAQYTEGSTTENLWFHNVRYDGKATFTGTLANTPLYLETIAYRDTVLVDTSAVVDWMFVERDTLVGGYTWAVTRARLSLEERARESADRDYVVPPHARP